MPEGCRKKGVLDMGRYRGDMEFLTEGKLLCVCTFAQFLNSWLMASLQNRHEGLEFGRHGASVGSGLGSGKESFLRSR